MYGALELAVSEHRKRSSDEMTFQGRQGVYPLEKRLSQHTEGGFSKRSSPLSASYPRPPLTDRGRFDERGEGQG